MSEEPITPAVETVTANRLDDARYYDNYFGGVPYSDEAHWTRFFGAVADMVVRDIAPRSVLDVGCAMGYLVEALRERGVEAWGFDVSDYAIANARPGARNFCWVGSVHDDIPQRYDLVTCIEVLEHLPAEEAPRGIENLCTHSDDILFTSTPLDFAEETHFNVRPPEYWAELFARHGFFRDVTFEAPDLAFWACRYRRSHDPFPRVVASYERAIWHYRHAAHERDRLLAQQVGALDENKRLKSEVERLNRSVSRAEERVRILEHELSRITASAAGRLILGVQERAVTFAPLGTRRQRALHRVTGAALRFLGSTRRPATTEMLGRSRSARTERGADAPVAQGRGATSGEDAGSQPGQAAEVQSPPS